MEYMILNCLVIRTQDDAGDTHTSNLTMNKPITTRWPKTETI